MKQFFFALLIPLLLITIDCYSQSNKGTEFWTAYMAHNNGAGGARGSAMVLYITSDVSTSGRVDIGSSLLQNFTVAANTVTFIPIPSTVYMSGAGKYLNNGIHITSQAPIAVYAHIYAANVSGATLLLPVNAMGKEYMSLNYTQLSNAPAATPAYSTFDVIATEDNTTVSITPSATMLTGEAADAEFTVNLNKGEVYQGLSPTDLTGTRIKSISTGAGSCKRIVVFSGSTRIGIGCLNTGGNGFSSDNLFQQVYPTSTWGKNYITAPLQSRPYDLYRIILSDPTTTVKLNGNTLNPGDFLNGLIYEFTSVTTNIISADKPVQVIQYSPTQDQNLSCIPSSGDLGDPEMIYLSPIEQGLDHVTLYSTGYYAILQSYVNVVILTSGVSSFTIDGRPYNNFIPIAGSPYSYAQIAVTSGPLAGNGNSSVSGTHNIKAAVPFNAVAYGFGNHESYGYAAGTNLQDLNEFVALQDPENPTGTRAAGCSNITYKLQVTIPYQTNSIVWKIDGVTSYTDNAPVVRSTTVKDDKTLYVYEYVKQFSATVGAHDVIATVFDPVADECGSYKDIENTITITDPATSEFEVTNTCFGDEAVFTDKTPLGPGTTIKTWLWDFGDNTTSKEAAPVHKYATPGNKTVRLTVTDNVGCTSVSTPKTIFISTKPEAGFTIASPDCVGQVITFTNTSKTKEGKITTLDWDFGDGTKETQQNGNSFTHVYADAQKYTITLTATNDGGCTSEVFSQPITITPLPVVDMVLPDACVTDQNSQFTSTSTIADNTESGFTYLWDFGDGTANKPNTSTLKDPQHTYRGQGDYTISLTITSKYGCSQTLTKPFTVNGADPRTKFDITNKDQLCSADSVTFVDTSNPDFGHVTKLVWYFDLDNHPNESVVFDRDHLRADKKYRHLYALNNTTAPVVYHAKLVAYTGESCTQEYGPQTVVINPNPQVALMLNSSPLADLTTLCQADVPIVIKGAANLPGTETFSGTGISSSGTFDPKASGPGMFTINYLFTSNAGCTYATSFQVMVNPTPVVTLPAVYNVLEGNQITFKPLANITEGNLTYQWSPSAGLSQDNVANPVVTVTEDTEYTLTVTSDKGCPTTVRTTVKVLKLPVIPNAFSPNGDGINDTWQIKYLDQYANATVEIFSRYGNKVFFSRGYSSPWDGRSNGGELPMGTYYYIISPNSGRKPVSGYVAIIR